MANNDKYSAMKKFEISTNIDTYQKWLAFNGFSSKPFSIYLGGKKTKWCLQFEESKKMRNALEIFLQKIYLEPGTSDFSINFDVSWTGITMGTENTAFLNKFSHVYSSIASIAGYKSSIICREVVTESRYSNFIPFKVHLEIQLKQKKDESYIVEPITTSVRDNTNFFENKELSDFTLVSSDGEKFPVHRFILAMYSSVLRTMFNSQMIETQSSTARIEDIDGGALREMLRFIYCGKVENLDDHAHALLLAAEKYEIEELKPLCGSSIMKNLSEVNIFDTIILADRCHSLNLLHECFEFIKKNYELLHDNKEWEKVDSKLMHQIMDSVQKGLIIKIKIS